LPKKKGKGGKKRSLYAAADRKNGGRKEMETLHSPNAKERRERQNPFPKRQPGKRGKRNEVAAEKERGKRSHMSNAKARSAKRRKEELISMEKGGGRRGITSAVKKSPFFPRKKKNHSTDPSNKRLNP